MLFKEFLALSDSDTAELVRREGPRVVVFPINGTRRWYYLEYGDGRVTTDHPDQAGFLDLILDRYIDLFELIFDHGISCLLSPILGPDIAARDPDYLQMVRAALEEITGGERFTTFYTRFDVRVRFYGDFDAFLEENAPAIPERIRRLQAATADRVGHQLLWGMFAHDPVEKVAGLSIDHHRETGRIPRREDLVTRYYGEYLPPADIFIGMLPPRVFDFPLLDIGKTALFFTTAPSPYLDREMLRRILYEFIFNRPTEDAYESQGSESWTALDDFYRARRHELIGAGRLAAGGRIWLPD
ncbi:MAG TPA: hypothetical protein VMN57_06705 [Anaerolineales bacterium]|nr:hypothetical protein [Anaerolineales bacterium]